VGGVTLAIVLCRPTWQEQLSMARFPPMKPQRYWLPLIVVIAISTVTMAIPYLLVGRPMSPSHLWKLGIVGSTAAYIFSFVGVLLTFLFGKTLVEQSRVGENWISEVKAYLICVGVCGLIAVGVARALGTHQEDADPVFGGGETVVDYKPTEDQRIRHALTWFFCLCVPSICGIYISFREKQQRRIAAIHRPLEQGGKP
jgi:hypothetical protein